MKAARRLLFAFSLLTFPVLIEACCNDAYKCCDVEAAKNFSVNDLKLKVQTFNGTTYVDAPHEIKTLDLSFNFNLDVTYISIRKQNWFKPTMAAYACDPEVSHSKETVTAFSVTSDQPLKFTETVTIAAGDDLRRFFSLGESLEGNPFYYESFNMVPAFQVAAAQDHDFTFRFTLSDGRVLEIRSGVHTLLPQ